MFTSCLTTLQQISKTYDESRHVVKNYFQSPS